MASTVEPDIAAAGVDDLTDPVVDGELDQEIDTGSLPHDDFPPKNLKKEKSEGEREKEEDGMEKLKSILVVSGAVIAVIGAVFAVAKKIKEA